MGLICIFLSYFSGFGVMFNLGGQVAGVHNLMPFLLIGIGVDDMFVIANAIDQVPFSKSAEERIVTGLSHAGPSITITSFTNALAFYFGSTTSLIALRSFCLFACTCIFMLYLTVLTIFTPVIAWDTRRITAKKGDCCGCCCCKEDTWICCDGYFLSDKQKEFSGTKTKGVAPESAFNTERDGEHPPVASPPDNEKEGSIEDGRLKLYKMEENLKCPP